MLNEESFAVEDAKVTSLNPTHEADISERIYAKFSSPVNASLSTVWHVILDKIENPSRYNPLTQDERIMERHGNQVLRQMKVLGMTIQESITWDETTREIQYTLVNNPFFIGQAVYAVVRSASYNSPDSLLITYTLDWEPYTEEARHLALQIQQKLARAVQQAILNAKTVAEQQDAQPESLIAVANAKEKVITTNKLERLPGTTSDMVKRLFSTGEAFDSERFITFFTDTPVYQFGNFEVCLDKAAIKQSADAFFSRISAVYHNIKMMWEVGDVVFVEMDVTYWRQDGSVITLPCCDIFRVAGDKFSELRIFMDVNPVFEPTILVSNSASVFTMSEGKRLLPPDTMKQHFAEHPDGKQRVAAGFAPKWSLVNPPKWSINSNGKIV